MEYKIIWEKWNDPFGENIDETMWNHYDDENIEDGSSELMNDEIIRSKINKPIKVIASPMGLIPYNEHTASSKIFNFWVGHTNFDISQPIIDIIEKSHGIELLDVFTRYRFRIAIGKSFSDSDTMISLNEKIQIFLENLYGTNT